MENSLSINLPKPKRQRREIPKEFLCKGIKSNGEHCSFASVKNEMYCKHHMPKVSVVNTCNEMIDSSTNTEDTMIMDIETANKIILELIDDRVEHEKQIAELLDIYRIFKTEFENLQCQ